MINKKKKGEPAFEETIYDDWSRDLEVAESPLSHRSLLFLGAVVFIVGAVVAFRILFLGLGTEGFYKARAEANLNQIKKLPAPRGQIVDRRGEVLAEDEPIFYVFLKVREFLRNVRYQAETIAFVKEVLGVEEEEVWKRIDENNSGVVSDAIVLGSNLDEKKLIEIESFNLPTLEVAAGFGRSYIEGEIFSSVIGYTGLVDAYDLKRYPELGGSDFVGKTGVEVYYDDYLRGQSGELVRVRDASGGVLEEKKEKEPQIGQSIKLTLDADLQRYFYKRLLLGLRSLGRSVGVGVAIDPRTGEVLALVNIPGFDNNVFSEGTKEERERLLNAPNEPLFNRAVGGFYSPGSTIKPLVAVAALEEGIITPERNIFSPGYLDVPNPYDPDKNSRFLDWRYQGYVDLKAAIAQSSNVYFYLVGGGSPSTVMSNRGITDDGIYGLGIERLRSWWEKFGLGKVLGIDLPGEGRGFLPDPQYKEKKTGTPWLLGDTYNVSIGQGDLLVTPIQLLSYIEAIGNGGRVYRPYVAVDLQEPKVVKDLSSYLGSILEVRRGMVAAVESEEGTANSLSLIPVSIAGKTGSAQVKGNSQENAFFVGYAPAENPEIAILVLVENSREGSLNAVPIAGDVFRWYYENRLGNNE